MSFNSQDTEEEERLYCSAPQNEEDIIWPGSDTEQSAEDLERKRRRYEWHAERFLRGQLPVIQSASLKGPFAQDVSVSCWSFFPPYQNLVGFSAKAILTSHIVGQSLEVSSTEKSAQLVAAGFERYVIYQSKCDETSCRSRDGTFEAK